MVKTKKNEENKNSMLAALSNPFSTGGGGVDFERRVQATFLLTLLIEGFSPILNSPVTSLEFQAKRLGRDFDDMVVHSSLDGVELKLLCQIKHGVQFAENKTFKEVIAAAWSDFNKSDFNKKSDKLVLITGLSPKVDVLRFIYSQANSAADAKDFLQRIEQTNYSNNDNRKKLNLIKKCLKTANKKDVSDQELWEFCKAFALLVFDVAYENNVNEFLIQSLIKSNSNNNTESVWYKLLNYASQLNKSAAHITFENMPMDIRAIFKEETLNETHSVETEVFLPDAFLAKLALIGAWNERNEFDQKFVEAFWGLSYAEVQSKVQEMSLIPSSCVTFFNGVWSVKQRKRLIEKCSQFYFDNDIKKLFSLSTDIFKQKDKRIQADGSFSILVPENGPFDNSDTLRTSVLRGMAILSNLSVSTPSCSDDLIDIESQKFVRNILINADETTWTSLDTTLSIIAEIHPKEYLESLENSILRLPQSIEATFPNSETNLMFSRNSICSILWSIECLAWEEKYFISCIRILGELAGLKYEKTNLSNTPIRSIVDIMLPWHPQTLATLQKQKNAIKSLQEESPEIAWKVIKKLLPNSTKTTTGTNRPKYIIVGLDKNVKVTNEQVLEMQNYYSQIAITLAKKDVNKLHDLLKYFEGMDRECAKSYLESIISMSLEWEDGNKYPVWSKLKIHRSWLIRDGDNKDEELMLLLNSAIEKTEPNDIRYKYRLLFEPQYYINSEQEEFSVSKLHEKRDLQKEVVLKVYEEYGPSAVVEFGEAVNNLYTIANYLGRGLDSQQIRCLIQLCFENKVDRIFLAQVLHGFVWNNSVSVITELELEKYPIDFISWIFTCFPLDKELFSLLDVYLAEKQESYWKIVKIPVLGLSEDSEPSYVWGKLCSCNRFVAAVNVFGTDIDNCEIPFGEIVEVLGKAATINSEDVLDEHAVRNLISFLQKRYSENIKEISEIELIYLPWLGSFSEVKPKALNYRLANEPQFFCELIELMYKKHSSKMHDRKIPEAMSKRLFEIFFKFSLIPGTDWDGVCHENIFVDWIDFCKKWANENDRTAVVLETIGNGLSYAKKGENGLIDEFVVKELNKAENEEMRRGYSVGIFNQRGVTWYDPEGKPEYQLAEEYNDLATKYEECGYSRFSETLRGISDSYTREAEYHKKQHLLEERHKEMLEDE